MRPDNNWYSLQDYGQLSPWERRQSDEEIQQDIFEMAFCLGRHERRLQTLSPKQQEGVLQARAMLGLAEVIGSLQ